jgi:peptidoglycan/LPS O-acetylase OafA/YrhL
MIKATRMIATGRRQLRTDIQQLRAVAVSMVLLFHAQVPGLAGGFLGVDIFLVISGYLITGMIIRGIKHGDFGLGTFFLNRAKRLLPAAYTTYLLTGVVALWLLTDVEMQRYLETLLGALTFTANIELWQGTDYFASEAKLNVLLHVWSLSVEEQFYFILPVVLLITPRHLWPLVILSGLALSLALCFIAVHLNPVASFYLLPTRAWELLIGAVLALNDHRIGPQLRNHLTRLGGLALTVIMLVPVFMPGQKFGFQHPSLDALLVTLATAVIIAGKPGFMNRSGPISNACYWLGGISYSLYLVHWPLFAFALNAHLGETPPLEIRLGLLTISVLLAAALYTGVERPVHRIDLSRQPLRATLLTFGATVSVACASLGLTELREAPRDYATASTPNHGLSLSCDFDGAFKPLEECKTGEMPRTLIWGDSFAMHLVGTLPEATHPILQATKSTCAPVLGIAPIVPNTGQDAGWATACIGFNDSVLAYLNEHPSIKTVILSSRFGQVLGQHNIGLLRLEGRLQKTSMTFESGTDRFLRTLEHITGGGRQVLVVGPTPSVGVDMLECLKRQEFGLITLGPYRNCLLDRSAARSYRSDILELLDNVAALPNVTVIDLIEVLCTKDDCNLWIEDTPVFRDAGHLTIDAARLLGKHDALGIVEALGG